MRVRDLGWVGFVEEDGSGSGEVGVEGRVRGVSEARLLMGRGRAGWSLCSWSGVGWREGV